MQRIAVDTGGADDNPGIDEVPAGVEAEKAASSFDAGDLRVEAEGAAVGGSVLRQGDGHAEGTQYRAGGRPQGRHGLVRHRRLKGVKRRLVQDLQPLHAVLHAPVQQLPQMGQLRLVEAQHQRAAPPVGEVQLFGEGLHHLRALHVEPGLGRTERRVKAGVADGGVGLAGAHTHVLAPLYQADVQPIAAEIPGHGAAHCAAAYDHRVIHMYYLFSKSRKTTGYSLCIHIKIAKARSLVNPPGGAAFLTGFPARLNDFFTIS